MKENMIARLGLERISPMTGRRERIQLILDSPVCESENQWSCSVTDPASKEKTKVFGVDSMQCLTLGMGYIGSRMNAMKKEGFKWGILKALMMISRLQSTSHPPKFTFSRGDQPSAGKQNGFF